MTGILKVEFFRLKKSVAFWLCFALSAALPFVSVVFTLILNSLMNYLGYGNAYLQTIQTQGGALYELTTFGSISADFNILAVIFTAVFLCAEFGQGTVRNMIVAGKKRSEIFGAFYIVSLSVGFLFLLTEFIFTMLLYGSVTGFGGLAADKVVTNMLYFFATGVSSMLCVVTMTCMFMFGTKKTHMTILFPLLICLILPNLVTMIATAIIGALESVAAVSETITYCIPFYNCTTLNGISPSGLNIGMVILYNLVLAAVFFVAGYFPFKKADLK